MKAWDEVNTPLACVAYTVRAFNNGRVRVCLNRCNRIEDVQVKPKEFWHQFEVLVWNIVMTDFEGNLLPEPVERFDVEASKKFYDLNAATAAFEKFLQEWTASNYDESGRFREVGNKLAPPSPDAPTISKESPMSDQLGSW